MNTTTRLAPLLLLALLVSACRTPPTALGHDGAVRLELPGYAGELPSLQARRALKALEGARLVVPGGELSAGEYRVGTFAVLPNPITAKSGGVTLEAGGVRAFLPLLRDPDVADLHRRVGAAIPAELASAELGVVSSAYARALGD